MLHDSRKQRLLLLRAFDKLYCYPSLPINLLCSIDVLPGKMFNPSHITQAAHIRALKEGKWGSNIHVFQCIGFQQFDSTGELFWIKKSRSPDSLRGHNDLAQHQGPLTYMAFTFTSLQPSSLTDESPKVPPFCQEGGAATRKAPVLPP